MKFGTHHLGSPLRSDREAGCLHKKGGQPRDSDMNETTIIVTTYVAELVATTASTGFHRA
jgi:hypothetical protein